MIPLQKKIYFTQMIMSPKINVFFEEVKEQKTYDELNVLHKIVKKG